MLTVYDCLVHRHDWRFVLLAAAVCLFTSAMAVILLRRAAETTGRSRLMGLMVAAAIIGIGVWSTHFIAMLAFEPNRPTGYDLGLTLASLAAAILLVTPSIGVGQSRLPGAPWLGGALGGLAIGVMHYIGMAAFETEGRLVWDAPLVVASIVFGTVGGAVAVRLGVSAGGWLRQAGSALLLTVAICGLHFIGMGAVSIVPDASAHVHALAIPGAWLARCVAAAACCILLLSALGLLIERSQIKAERRRRQELADTAVEGLVVCDDGVIVTANAAFEHMAGLSEAQARGRALAQMIDPAAADRLASGRPEQFEARLTTANGEAIPIEIITRTLRFNGRMQQGVAVRDLRARDLADAQIRFLALHDPLTGLANRAHFNDRLESELERRRRKGDAMAVLCLDLDRFKPINDVFGHAAGDMVLKTVSARIQAELGADDVLGRLGGDEFAVICLGDCRPAAIAELSERILTAVQPEIMLEDRSALVGVSVGIALFPGDGETSAALLRNADAALYRAKADGRGAYRFFEASIGADLRERQGLEFDLRRAVGRGELRLVYQPQTSVLDGEVFGFEALLRWTHPERGDIPPDRFIPIAEETGLILPIGEWVMRQACAEAAKWERPLQIAVNLSGVQLHSANLASLVREVLFETGLNPERLEFEITETALIADFDHALKVLHEIRALGVKIAMDDFGTGYSSLSNLRAFPFDKIKIDKSFVHDVHRNEQAATIVRAIVGLARGLNLTVLAEGVETLEELAFLNREMCPEAQGFYFGRPGEIGEFAALTAAPRDKRKAG